MASSPYLVEIDSLEIQVIIDNELDPLSQPAPDTVQLAGGTMPLIALSTSPSLQPGERGGAVKEFRMEDICCSAHGLSIMIVRSSHLRRKDICLQIVQTATRGDIKRTVLFDTGPEDQAWEKNVKRLKADISQIDLIVLSHWHRDHSGNLFLCTTIYYANNHIGGMLKAIDMIHQAKKAKSENKNVVVDVHPSRPDYRGFALGDKIVSLQADPTFQEITNHGATLNKHDETHTILDDMFLVSGEIPRETTYENGVKFGMRFDQSENEWISDEKIADERFLMCNLKGPLSILLAAQPR